MFKFFPKYVVGSELLVLEVTVIFTQELLQHEPDGEELSLGPEVLVYFQLTFEDKIPEEFNGVYYHHF